MLWAEHASLLEVCWQTLGIYGQPVYLQTASVARWRQWYNQSVGFSHSWWILLSFPSFFASLDCKEHVYTGWKLHFVSEYRCKQTQLQNHKTSINLLKSTSTVIMRSNPKCSIYSTPILHLRYKTFSTQLDTVQFFKLAFHKVARILYW